MAEETVEAPPQAEEQPTTTLEERGFGNLAEAFDKAFPATAENKEGGDALRPDTTPRTSKGAATSEPEAAPAAEPPPAETKPAAKQDELPDFLTGEKPKAEEKPPGDPDLPPPTGKESTGMKQLRTAYENLKKQSQTKEAEFTAQIEALKQAPPQEPDAAATIAQQQKQIEELSGILERKYIEDHPAILREFSEPRNRLVSDVHQILTDAKVDPIQWDRAMTLTGVARTEALEALYEDLPKSTQTVLGSAIQQILSLDSRKEAYLADRKGLKERLTAEEQKQRYQSLQEHEKNTLQMLDMAQTDLIDRMGIEVYKKSDDPAHAKWNESVEKMKADARKILLETTDPSVMARAALLAPAALQFRYLYHMFRDKYQESQKELAAIRNAEPTLQSRGETPLTEEDDKLSFAEAAAKSAFSKI